MTETITIRTDPETEHAAQLRRAVLAMDLGEPDGTDVAAGLARDRDDER